MKLFLILSLASVSLAFNSDEWASFKLQYKKTYRHELEENLRMKVYMSNKKIIDEHNALYEKGLVSYKMKINQFGDMLSSEFSLKMNGFNGTILKKVRKPAFFLAPSLSVPVSIDWRKKGAVTNVKDQSFCGACWAFSSTGALEGQNFRKTGQLVSLSEQNLVDCSSTYGNNGCGGGLMDLAFQYIQDNSGIDSEDAYPYEARNSTCRFKVGSISAHVKGFLDIPSGDEDALMTAVSSIGPISVAIDASHLSFQFYSSGVYDEPACSSETLNHGVLAVGYGTENGQEYWLVKNSWNTSWGDEGYVKIARNKGNLCGIATSASYPLV